jgi:hypothetical protein
MKKLTFIAVLGALIMGCTPSTVIQKSWKDPSSTAKINEFKKVLVIVFAQSETARRQAEEALAAKFQGRGVPSYNQKVMVEKGANSEAISAALKAEGFDAALVTRLIDKEKETSYVPGTTTYAGGFRGYYGYGYGAYSSPGYYVEDKIYYIETNVYDLAADKLVWSAVTSSTNPSKLDKTINEIATVLADKMEEDGFLVRPAKK